MLRMKPRTQSLLGKCYTTEPYPTPYPTPRLIYEIKSYIEPVLVKYPRQSLELWGKSGIEIELWHCWGLGEAREDRRDSSLEEKDAVSGM